MKFKKLLCLLLTFLLCTNFFIIGKVYALEGTYNSQKEFESALLAEGTSIKSKPSNYSVNLSYYNKFHKIIYGDLSIIPSSVQVKSSINGAYKYIGYTLDEQYYINPDYPQDNDNPDCADNWNFIAFSGAYDSWYMIKDSVQREYNLHTHFIPKYGASTLYAAKIGMDKVRVQSPATLISQGNFEVKHKDKDGKTWWATFEIPSIAKNLMLSGDITTTKTQYTVSKGNNVYIPTTVKASLTGEGIKDSYVQGLTARVTEICINGTSKYTIADIGDSKEKILNIQSMGNITIPSSDLHSGNNTVEIKGYAAYSSFFKDAAGQFDRANKALTKVVNITVDDGTVDDGVFINAITDPGNSPTGGIKNVSVLVDGGTNSSKQIKNMQLFCKKKEDTSFQAGHLQTTGKTTTDTFNFAIDTKGRDFTQYFDANIIVNYTDGSKSEKIVQAFTVFAISADVNHPPVAKIVGSPTAIIGETARYSGSGSYDTDGDKLTYSWSYSPSSAILDGDLNTNYINIQFMQVTRFTLYLTVTDEYGLSDSTEKTVDVMQPTPVAIINKSGTFKENRKVILDARNSFSGSPIVGMDWSKTKWEITPAAEGVNLTDIKTKDSYNGSSLINLVFKKKGTYKIKLSVTNSWGSSDTTESELIIGPDIEPVADFYMKDAVLRDPNNNGLATINIYDNSKSMDNDYIGKRIWLFSFDQNNNGTWQDDKWYVWNNNQWCLLGTYADVLSLDINKIIDGNKNTVQISTEHVGKYDVQLIVQENFGDDTIPDFITVDDKKTNSTINK